MSPSDPADWSVFRPLVEAVTVPVLANGDIYSAADVRALMEEHGVSSVLLARGALRNVGLFGEAKGRAPMALDDVIRDYIRLTAQFDNHFFNTKCVPRAATCAPTHCCSPRHGAPGTLSCR